MPPVGSASVLTDMAFYGSIVLSPAIVPISIISTESASEGIGLYAAGLTGLYLTSRIMSWLIGKGWCSPLMDNWSPWNVTHTPIHNSVIYLDEKINGKIKN